MKRLQDIAAGLAILAGLALMVLAVWPAHAGIFFNSDSCSPSVRCDFDRDMAAEFDAYYRQQAVCQLDADKFFYEYHAPMSEWKNHIELCMQAAGYDAVASIKGDGERVIQRWVLRSAADLRIARRRLQASTLPPRTTLETHDKCFDAFPEQLAD